MSDYEHGHNPEHEGFDSHDSPPDDRQPEPSQPTKKRGPKPMTDEPTVRVEGQLFPWQYDAASAIVSRLKIENRSTPSPERRRMTINTLIRIGMALVLEHESALHGKTEDELSAALRQSIEARIREHSS